MHSGSVLVSYFAALVGPWFSNPGLAVVEVPTTGRTAVRTYARSVHIETPSEVNDNFSRSVHTAVLAHRLAALPLLPCSHGSDKLFCSRLADHSRESLTCVVRVHRPSKRHPEVEHSPSYHHHRTREKGANADRTHPGSPVLKWTRGRSGAAASFVRLPVLCVPA